MNDNHIFKDTFSPWRYPSNWWKNIQSFFRHIKFSIQRLRLGYSDWDTYDTSYYIDNCLIGMLTTLKEKPGYPCDYDTKEDWDAVLDEIIGALKEAVRTQYVFNMELNDEIHQNWEKASDYINTHKMRIENPDGSILHKYPDEVPQWVDEAKQAYFNWAQNEYKYHQECVEKAYALLAKYHDNLWW